MERVLLVDVSGRGVERGEGRRIAMVVMGRVGTVTGLLVVAIVWRMVARDV